MSAHGSLRTMHNIAVFSFCRLRNGSEGAKKRKAAADMRFAIDSNDQQREGIDNNDGDDVVVDDNYHRDGQ